MRRERAREGEVMDGSLRSFPISLRSIGHVLETEVNRWNEERHDREDRREVIARSPNAAKKLKAFGSGFSITHFALPYTAPTLFVRSLASSCSHHPTHLLPSPVKAGTVWSCLHASGAISFHCLPSSLLSCHSIHSSDER